jgi:hypothetical protein
MKEQASGGQGLCPCTPGSRMLRGSFLAPPHSLTGFARGPCKFTGIAFSNLSGSPNRQVNPRWAFPWLLWLDE